MCDVEGVKYAKQGKKIPTKCILKDIPDEVVDIPHSVFGQLRIHFITEAYNLLLSKGEIEDYNCIQNSI